MHDVDGVHPRNACFLRTIPTAKNLISTQAPTSAHLVRPRLAPIVKARLWGESGQVQLPLPSTASRRNQSVVE